MVELEKPRFRRGESVKNPYGGNISDDPLSQTLHKSAVVKGFETQNALAKALEISPYTVRNWYKGKDTPSPAVFGDLLVLLDLNDKEREPLVEAYANRLVKRKVLRVKKHRSVLQPSDNPIAKWIDDACEKENISVNQLAHKLGLNKLRRNYQPSLRILNNIRQNAKEALGLSEEQINALNRLIDGQIEQRLEAGHWFQESVTGSHLKKEQKGLPYRTYNGEQAAVELGVTRPTVHKYRKKFGMPYLLTERNLRILKQHLEKTKGRREKIQQSRMNGSLRIGS